VTLANPAANNSFQYVVGAYYDNVFVAPAAPAHVIATVTSVAFTVANQSNKVAAYL
jgi:hypothetical protein